MAADYTVTLDRVGKTFGSSMTVDTSKTWEIAFICTVRLWAYVQLYALDSSNNLTLFLYAGGLSGVADSLNQAPAGTELTLPIYKSAQSYFFKANAGTITFYGLCVG
jgi:hypothetical protein